MKKLTLLLLPILLLAACQPTTEETILEVAEPAVLSEAVDGFITYTSNELGLTFDYPEVSYEKANSVTEEGNVVTLWTQEGEENLRELLTIRVKELRPEEAYHSFEEYLNATLLDNSESCRIELSKEEDDMVVFAFNSEVALYENDFDENCEIYTTIQYYKDQPAYFALVGHGQDAPFELEDTEKFYDSIHLFVD